ncbi:MAG: divergent polysaccharide deacetylase family protein [Pseudomonadota bacterium]
MLDAAPVDTAPAPPPPTQFASSEPDVLPRLIQPDIEAPEPDTAPAAQPVADTRPPIEAFAADFAPSGDAPRFGLILLDTEDAPALDLTGLTLPVAVALDPLLPDATERMANLRAAGLEVLVLTPLVEGATASDVEVAFQSFFASVSQAVAVMDVPDAVLQGDRQRAEQVVEILKATGHGLLTYDKGLNAILQVAETDAVPALKVTQVFDTGDSDAARMKRFLDQGAFRSGRDGQAVMVGYLRAETLETLSDWAQGNRAASVQMAPVSAILLQK